MGVQDAQVALQAATRYEFEVCTVLLIQPLTLCFLDSSRMPTSLSAAAWAVYIFARVTLRLSYALCRALISACAACTHVTMLSDLQHSFFQVHVRMPATLIRLAPAHAQARTGKHMRMYLLVALVVVQLGVARVQDVLGGLQLLGQHRLLVLGCGLGSPELCNLHTFVSLSLHSCLSARSLGTLLRPLIAEWKGPALQALLRPVKPRDMSPCCHLCSECVHLRLQLVPLCVDLPQVAGLLKSSQKDHILLACIHTQTGYCCADLVQPTQPVIDKNAWAFPARTAV